MNMSNIGFIGFGEASTNIIEGMIKHKQDVVVFIYDIDYSKYEKAKESSYIKNIIIVGSLEELLSKASTIFIAIPSIGVMNLINQMKTIVFQDKCFLDICTSSPDVKSLLYNLASNKQSTYIDIGVMGSVLKDKNNVLMYASGSFDEAVISELNDIYGFNIIKIGSKVGDASIIKLCRSIFMKGLAALIIETDAVSSKFGVKKEVFDSISRTMDNDLFEVYSKRLSDGTYKHLQRRTNEIREVCDIFKEDNKMIMSKATFELYESLRDNKDE